MQSYNPTDWIEIDLGDSQPAPQGKLKIITTDRDAAISIAAHNGEYVLAALGSCDFTIPNDCRFVITGKKGCKAFLYYPAPATVDQDETVFTNMDRQPHESGTMMEVRRALREQEIRNMGQMREMRKTMHDLRAAKSAAAPIESAPADDPVVTPDEDSPESAEN